MLLNSNGQAKVSHSWKHFAYRLLGSLQKYLISKNQFHPVFYFFYFFFFFFGGGGGGGVNTGLIRVFGGGGVNRISLLCVVFPMEVQH